jgi:hypothetical protein
MLTGLTSRGRLTAKCLTVVVIVVLGLALSAGPAAAGPPEHWTVDFGGHPHILTGMCAFDIQLIGVGTAHGTDFFDNNGTLIRMQFNAVEQDTFTANGKTLVSHPYTFNGQWYFDSDGNVTEAYGSGVFVRVPLPDGGVFIGAGRNDTPHPGPYTYDPDHGVLHNLEGFCAALAP